MGIVLNGLQGPVVVNGRTYNAVMPALRLTDDNVADVLTYVYSQWGNAGKVVAPALVSQIRLCPWCETGGRPPGP
ncbi:MAG: cytochrome c [Gemmatimonadetes bacterium]|nr:cytochrome c [Gemmatimonadota bacterium]